MKQTRKDFPIFNNHHHLVYLDNAATTQKPQIVIDTIKKFYENSNANIHRGIYTLSQNATEQFEQTRQKIKTFINAQHASEIIFTSGTTEAINLVATGWAKKHLQKGDIVVLSEMEHNSNIIPWLHLRDEIGINVLFLPITTNFQLKYHLPFSQKIKKQIKLIAITHASNVLGTINPIKKMVDYFHKETPNAKILLDAAQSIAHIPMNVQHLDIDFLSFSSHKLFGPSGVGVLWGKQQIIETMDPLLFGSSMVTQVTQQKIFFADSPYKFEPGTQNIEGVVGLGKALDYLTIKGMEDIQTYERQLTEYALKQLHKIKQITLYGQATSTNRLGIFSFSIPPLHSHDVAEIFNREDIAVRSGHHCAHILMQRLQTREAIRASLAFYNTKKDIEALIAGIHTVCKVFSL
jgi:cysteine desulfurase / selenocysteine lyase